MSGITKKQFKLWLIEAPPGAEIEYTTEVRRDEDLMEIARVASDEGRVALFRRRVDDEMLLVCRKLSGAGRRFLQSAPRLGRKVRRDPRTYTPFTHASGRGLAAPSLPDGFDGPASRRQQPRIGTSHDTDD